jgi:hypothetical protein
MQVYESVIVRIDIVESAGVDVDGVHVRSPDISVRGG